MVGGGVDPPRQLPPRRKGENMAGYNKRRLRELQSAVRMSNRELRHPDEKGLAKAMGSIAEGKLDTGHLKAWMAAYPKVVEVAARILKTTEVVVDKAGTSQEAVASKIPDTSQILAAVRELAKKAESQEERTRVLEALERIHQGEVKRTKTVKDINENNNTLWVIVGKSLSVMGTLVLAAAVVVATTAAMTRRSRS